MPSPPRDGSPPRTRAERPSVPSAPAIRIGRYEIGRLLGSGSRGSVHRTRHPEIPHPLIIKTRRISNRRDVEIEMQAMLRACDVEHPNLGRIVEVGIEKGMLFIVGEFIDGIDLETCLERHGALPLPLGIEITRQCAWALHGLAEHDLVHGGLHPGNIFLLADGRVKIVDYGVARPSGARSSGRTDDNHRLAHAAPESAQPGAYSIRSDIYSLGSILHQMLTGHPPPKAESSGNRAPVSVRESLAALRPDVDPAILHCLERMTSDDPADRHHTPAMIVDDLTPLERMRRFDDLIEECGAREHEPATSFRPPEPAAFARDPVAADHSAPAPAPPPSEGRKTRDTRAAPAPSDDLEITQPIAHLARKTPAKTQRAPRSLRRVIEPVAALVLVCVAVATAALWWTSRDRGSPPSIDEGFAAAERSLETSVSATADTEEAIRPVPTLEAEAPADIAATPPWNGDLLSLVEVPEDVIAGQWSWNGDDFLQNTASRWSRLELPLSPRDRYDVTMEFVPIEGRGEVFLLFPVGEFWARWSMWCGDLWHMGFNWDDALYSEDNPTWTIAREGMELGKTYEVRLEVRSSEVTAYLDGRLLRRWKADFEHLTPATFVALPNPGRLGIGSDQVAVVFRKAHVKEYGSR